MAPGPIPLPFIGALYVFPKEFTEIPFTLSKLTSQYGGVCTIQLPSGGYVFESLTILNILKKVSYHLNRNLKLYHILHSMYFLLQEKTPQTNVSFTHRLI